MKKLAIISAFLLMFAFIPSLLAQAQEQEREQRQRDTQTQQQDQDTQRQDRSTTTTQDTQRQDRTTTTHSQDEMASTSTFIGELVELDTADKQITVKNSEGDEMEFDYDEQTEISGADQNVAGLFSEGGMKLTVTYREESGFMGGNTATKIEVGEGRSQGMERGIGQDPQQQGSQRYGQTQDRTTAQTESTRTQQDQDQSSTWNQDRTAQTQRDHDRSSTQTQDHTTAQTESTRTQQDQDQDQSSTWNQDRTAQTQRDQEQSSTWNQDRTETERDQDRSSTQAQDRSSTQAQDRSSTQSQERSSTERSRQYGSQQASTFSGELVDVDTTQQKLTVKNSQGEEMEFSYDQQTEVSGADENIAGLASKSGSKVTIDYSEEGEGLSKEKTAQKIHVEQQRQPQDR